MTNLEKLTKVVQKNSKLRMLLMYAIADNCKESITLSTSDDYSSTLLSAAVEQHSNLKLNNKQLDECAGVLLRTIESVELEGTNSKKERLIVLEKGLKAEITESVKEALKSIPETLEIEGIEKLSVDAIDSVVLWMMVRDVIEQVPVCKETIKAATSYRKQDKKQEQKSQTTTEEPDNGGLSSEKVQATLESFATSKYAKIPYKKLSKQDKNIIKGIANVLETEYAAAGQSMIKEPIDKDLEEKAVMLTAKISERIKMPNTLEFVRDCLKTDGDSVSLDNALISVIYSEYVIAMYDKIFAKGNNANLSALYESLKQPGFSSLILTSEYTDVKTEDAIKELEHLYYVKKMDEQSKAEESKKQEVVPVTETVIDVEAKVVEETAGNATGEKAKKVKKVKVRKEKTPKEPKTLSQMGFFARRIELMKEKRSEHPSEVKMALLSGRF